MIGCTGPVPGAQAAAHCWNSASSGWRCATVSVIRTVCRWKTQGARAIQIASADDHRRAGRAGGAAADRELDAIAVGQEGDDRERRDDQRGDEQRGARPVEDRGEGDRQADDGVGEGDERGERAPEEQEQRDGR